MSWQTDKNGNAYQTPDGKPPAFPQTVVLPNGGTGTIAHNEVTPIKK